jgi:hypothetical protein
MFVFEKLECPAVEYEIEKSEKTKQNKNKVGQHLF